MRQVEPICSPRILEVLASKVHQHLGLDFSGARQADLLRRLQLLALEQEQEPEGWLESLAFAEWDDARIQALIPAFTVGETYFRRDAEAFDWLCGNYLLPLLQRRREAGQHYLRVWSAACCTGEEAYSLLFLIDELLGMERSSWTVEVLASDINGHFLSRAEQACYGANAFRRNETTFRDRYFHAEGRSWRVKPAWRGRIRFLRHNLANGRLPAPDKGLAAIDLILCRNVLMYFSAERAAATLRRLLACLSGDGLLLLSAVEAGLATQAGLNGFWAGSNYALTPRAHVPPRRAEPQPVVSVAPAIWQPIPEQSAITLPQAAPVPVNPLPDFGELWRAAEAALAQGRPGAAREAIQDCLSYPGVGVTQRHEACLLMARSWADQQHIEEARDWLQRALDLCPTAPHAHWLQALLAKQEGDVRSALRALQRVLYLEPECAMAYFQQGLLLRESGRRQAGDKALQDCRQLLEGARGDTPVALGDGLSNGQLRQLCDQLLEGSACPNR